MTTTSHRDEYIADIIERELEMFLSTQNEGGPASCQQNPDMFRHWRWMIFSVLSDAYIASYLQDLMDAKSVGRNLLMEKYARMDNLIPCVSPNMEKVHRITEVERIWLTQLAEEFPLQFAQQMQRFDFYFSPEIETLSEKTLDCYLECIAQAQAEGRNLCKERYENMYSRMNLPSVAEKEHLLRAKQQA